MVVCCQHQNKDLTHELEFAGEKVASLKADRDRLQASLTASKELLRDLDSHVDDVKVMAKQHQRDRERERADDVRVKFDQGAEIQRLRQQVAELELQVADSRRVEVQGREQRELERMRRSVTPTRSRSRDSADGTQV